MSQQLLRLIGVSALTAATLGSCTGAVLGHYTVRGGLHLAGWEVPDRGVDADVAGTEPPKALVRVAERFEFPTEALPFRPASAETVDPEFAEAGDVAERALFDPADADYGVIETAAWHEAEGDQSELTGAFTD
jgi:hypothetical protein